MDTQRSGALRIALVAPPFLPIPPLRYGGTERVVGVLADGFYRRGHDLTVFAAGDSKTPGRLVPVVPKSTWQSASVDTTESLMALTVDAVESRQDQFDVIHSHIEWHGFDFAARAGTPVVSTLHGRIDIGPTAEKLPEYPQVPLIAISDRQRSYLPDLNCCSGSDARNRQSWQAFRYRTSVAMNYLPLAILAPVDLRCSEGIDAGLAVDD